MSRTAGTKKAETHDRIVRAAAKAIRRDGYDGTSVAEVMHEAGLTHGGFYSHFPSREAMLAEGLDRAASESVESLVGSATVRAAKEHIHPLEALVGFYLSDRHVAATESGCTIAALGSETRRQSPEIRRVATERFEELVAALGQLSATTPGTAEPLATMSTLVGALVISRIVDDPDLSRQVREAASRLVLGKQHS